MGILLAFAPFVIFAVLDRVVGPASAPAAGAVASAALVACKLAVSRHMKILELGTFVLFSGLALYTLLNKAHWSVIGVRLRVDAGLLLIVLGSMAARRPFSLQYARQRVAPELWNQPEFIRTNYVTTTVWALAFLVMVVAELGLRYFPGLPPRVGIVVIILALIGATKFTGRYPDREKRWSDTWVSKYPREHEVTARNCCWTFPRSTYFGTHCSCRWRGRSIAHEGGTKRVHSCVRNVRLRV